MDIVVEWNNLNVCSMCVFLMSDMFDLTSDLEHPGPRTHHVVVVVRAGQAPLLVRPSLLYVGCDLPRQIIRGEGEGNTHDFGKFLF